MILKNNSKIRLGGKKNYITTIKKENHREAKIGTTIKTIVLNDLEFPINKKVRKIGNSRVITIPTYLTKNQLLKKGSRIDKITI